MRFFPNDFAFGNAVCRERIHRLYAVIKTELGIGNRYRDAAVAVDLKRIVGRIVSVVDADLRGYNIAVRTEVAE